MPRTTRNTERGQTLVLVAFSLIVLIGLVGLAVDGGRLFWERRTLQNAVDSAALAASDNYQDSQSISSSLQAAARATLSQGNCRGGGDSLSVVGNGDILVPGGSVQSSGSVSLGGRRAAISAGSFSVNCTSPVPSGITASNGTFTGIAPLSDPAF